MTHGDDVLSEQCKICPQQKSADLEAVTEELESTKAQLHSVENSKGWLERRLNETEDNLNTTRDEFEMQLEGKKRDHEDSICRLNQQHLEEVQVCGRIGGLHSEEPTKQKKQDGGEMACNVCAFVKHCLQQLKEELGAAEKAKEEQENVIMKLKQVGL